jgi:hypothetical protein
MENPEIDQQIEAARKSRKQMATASGSAAST